MRVPTAFTCTLTVVLIAGTETRAHERSMGASPRDSAAILALENYIGEWITEEEMTSPSGDKFRFGYTLRWFDAGKTIAKMLITRVDAKGRDSLIWEGFKGWDRTGSRAYYYAFDTSGRRAEGVLRLVNDSTLLNEYTGYGPSGDPLQIRDESVLRERERFLTRTSIRRDGKWRVVRTDMWVPRGEGE